MDILIHSLLDTARTLNTSLHIRYYAHAHSLGKRPASQSQSIESSASEGTTVMTSYVIIRREFSYLEPLIRSLFEEAEDVKVLIDRRVEDRQEDTPPEEGDRRRPGNRRDSKPMLDILISVDS